MEIATLTNPAPTPNSNWALFLDLDGTLLDIAETPDTVVIPSMLVPAITAASEYLGGALAVISGRSLSDIDSILAPSAFPCAGEHGAIIRQPNGTVETATPAQAVSTDWRARLEAAIKHWDGVLLEYKTFNVTVHYRQALERRDDVYDLLERTIADGPPGFEILAAHMAFELRHRGLTKGGAVFTFMQQPAFAGRVPVFVGDDVTDEDGFRAAISLGGIALHVAEAFDGKPENVRNWLATFHTARKA